MFTFEIAFISFSSVQQEIIRRRLTSISVASAIGRQVEQNIFTESRLPVTSAKEILEGILNACDDHHQTVKNDYIDSCQKHILKGPLTGGLRPGLLGRAVTGDDFYDNVYTSRRSVFPSLPRAREWVRQMLRLSARQTAYRMRRTLLGRYVMWATYCKSNPYRNPFELLAGTADDLRDILGMDPADRGKPVLLFVYEPPSDLDLRYPTVADAQWHHQFRPAPDDPQVESGLTLPHTPELECQPEVVHEPVMGETIREAIKEVL